MIKDSDHRQGAVVAIAVLKKNIVMQCKQIVAHLHLSDRPTCTSRTAPEEHEEIIPWPSALWAMQHKIGTEETEQWSLRRGHLSARIVRA